MVRVRHASYVKTSIQKGAKFLRSKEPQGQQQLLPGIPDDLTLELITPKLPWSALILLPLVSRVWQRAVQSRQVYDARVRAQATEPLIVPRYFGPRFGPHIIFGKSKPGLAISSTRDGTCRVLPGIRPSVNEPEFPWATHIASYDGKVYALAGSKIFHSNTRVFVLDLAGHRQWEECASLHGPRQFGEGSGYVKDGKIYIGKSSLAAEVYDPELNVWSLTPSGMFKERDRSSLAV